jgi:energy-coupling factor transport system ATP-binding protein
MGIIAVEGLTFTYPGAAGPALEDVHMSVEQSGFVVVCGQSGCGKTTLLRNLKKELKPHGKTEGTIRYQGIDIHKLGEKRSAAEIGFVMQDPENQIVTDTVWHELAFGLENIGCPTPVIRRRIAETAHFFGINEWFEKPVFELSGGQKQLLNLAAVMAMQPQLLLLDEPTAQLDPVAAKDFLTIVQRLNLELGTTVVMVEHRLEELFPIADRVILMDRGRLEFSGPPKAFARYISGCPGHRFSKALPSAVQIRSGLSAPGDAYPLSVREGRLWLQAYARENGCRDRIDQAETPPVVREGAPALEAKDLWFRYKPGSDFVLKGLSVAFHTGTVYAVVGGNGSGKTTMLSLLAGLYRPVRGAVRIKGQDIRRMKPEVLYKNRLVLLMQNPRSMFVWDTVREDLTDAAGQLKPDNAREEVERICDFLGISHLLDSHPYDLSGGEQQKAALGKLLLLDPEILLLDEPTKGLDVYAKEELAGLLRARAGQGNTVVMATHDLEFAARYVDVCSMVFNGEIICTENAKTFFVGNSFYTTSANRISRGIVEDAVTIEDVIERCR